MNVPLYASLCDAGIAAGIVLLLALPAIFRPARALIAIAVAVAFLDDFATVWPNVRGSPLDIIHGRWNWNGKLLDIVVLLVIAAIFVRARLFTRRELGLTLVQRPGTGRALLFYIVPLLVLFTIAVWKFSSHEVPHLETVAYEVTLPGMAEELYFRGLLLALFDRMFPPSRTILGAPMGYGAIATSLVFGAVHTFSVSGSLHVEFSAVAGLWPFVVGLILAWIRARSGSLLLPILYHNATNTIGVVLPAFL
ncbi:MAG TPA: CPBP family intramembrane glutamic endopeptidase [Rhizomicrobium sp.]|jgi:hypothetical protein